MVKSLPVPDLSKIAGFVERFWSKIEWQGTRGDACWLWMGTTTIRGYGRIKVDGQWFPAHRIAWVLRYGPIDESMVIDHLCRKKVCVNPAHLELVSARMNTLRGDGPTAVYARRTHCQQGHAFTLENTRIDPTTGGRRCRACGRLTSQQYRRKRA